MNIFGFNITKQSAGLALNQLPPIPPVESEASKDPSAFNYGGGSSYVGNSYSSKSFDGEKTPGELGAPVNLVHDYNAIRHRAYEAYGTNDVVKILINKYIEWVCGNGLKLQSEPLGSVLELEKVLPAGFNLRQLSNNIEAYWSTFANSKKSDFAGMFTLHENAERSYVTKFIGGSVLTILRVDEKYNITVQVVDGQHVKQPVFQGELLKEAKERGNMVRNGIEISPAGKHVAFFVLKKSDKNILGEFERVEAVSASTGCVMAWLSFGDKFRIDHDMGISRIATILEKVKKLDRYTEATVASAEERAKVPWTIEHDRFSDGEDPLLNRFTKTTPSSVTDPYALGELAAKKISVTEEKTVYNLPIGAKFSTVNSQAEIQYDPFFNAIFTQVAAAINVPREVALQVFSSNYSASRASINGWGYTIDIERAAHARDFYKNIYDLVVYVLVMQNKVQAPGYVKAVNTGNWIVTDAYSNARFTGANMPNIDPLKEAKAVRAMLGDDSTPLMTYEQATEQLGNGSFAENVKKIKEERENVPELLPDQQPKSANTETIKPGEGSED